MKIFRENITSGNEKIARFLGWFTEDDDDRPYPTWFEKDDNAIYIAYSIHNNYPHLDLPFHRDWNMLWKVIEKIEDLALYEILRTCIRLKSVVMVLLHIRTNGVVMKIVLFIDIIHTTTDFKTLFLLLLHLLIGITKKTNKMTYNYTKLAKIENDPTKHYPNKNESALLRKIKSETGLSEEEIRDIKKYRKMLAEASKSSEKSLTSATEKYYKNIIKTACQKTGLVPQHPKTQELLKELLSRKKSWHLPWFLYNSNESPKSVVEKYAKK